jgi:hypothetical protein
VYPTNGVYGQDVVLALYTGMSIPPPPIWGFMQHSWLPDEPIPPGEPLRPWWPFFCYSESNARALDGRGGSPVIPIGAPFLYIDRLFAPLGAGANRSRGHGTIYYPFHYFGEPETVPWHGKLADWLRDTQGRDVTVNLHWHDFENASIVELYRQRELRVVCHGRSSSSLFLIQQYVHLLGYERVMANRVSTPLWHAASLGLRVEVAGPVFIVDHPWMPDDETEESVLAHEQGRWPELFAGVEGEDARRLAERELGAEHVREPGELKELLGWTPLGRARSALVKPLWDASRKVAERFPGRF